MLFYKTLLVVVGGAVALVAQSIWTRYANQTLGQSAITISAVIGISLAGLAAGSAWGGRIAGRWGASNVKGGRFAADRLLQNWTGENFAGDRTAAMFLLTAGLLLLLAEGIFQTFNLTGWASWLGQLGMGETPPTSRLIQSLVAVMVALPIGPVSFFTGAMFPCLFSNANQNAAQVARLSAMETVGGCAGALFAGFYGVQTFGLTFTILAAAGLAIFVGGGIAFFLRSAQTSVSTSIKPTNELLAFSLDTNGKILLFAVAMAGVCSLGMEIVWQRLLVLVVGTDSYSYTIVVTSYLIGLATGAGWSSAWLRQSNAGGAGLSLRRISYLQITGAATCVVVLMLIHYLASGAGQQWTVTPWFGVSLPIAKRFLLCMGVLIVPAAVYGVCFPLAVDAVANGLLIAKQKETGNSSALAQATGWVYGAVATGNVFGVFVCGFLLIPTFGLQWSLLILSGGLATMAWAFFGLAHIPRGDSRRPATPFPLFNLALTAIFVVLAIWGVLPVQPIGVTYDTAKTDLRFYREGPANTVAVLADRSNPDLRRMTVDGIVIGQSGQNVEEKQLMLAHLASLIRFSQVEKSTATPARSKNTIVIGLGSGLLSGEVANLKETATVTTVELSPAVIQAAVFFEDLINPHPEVKSLIVQGDGLHWLSTSRQKFNAIISDGKSRPGHIGNASFFSVEYYRSALTHLTDDGIFAQWFSLDASPDELPVVLETFGDVFPHAYVGIAAPGSIYLLGSRHSLSLDANRINDYFLGPGQSLRRYAWRTADDFRSMLWIDIASACQSRSVPPANSQRHPRLERFSLDVGHQQLTKNKITNLDALIKLIDASPQDAGIVVPPLESSESQTNELLAAEKVHQAARRLIVAAQIQLQQSSGWLDRAANHLRPAFRTLPLLSRGGTLASYFLDAAAVASQNSDSQGEVSFLIKAAEMLPGDEKMQLRVARRLYLRRLFSQAVAHYDQALRLNPGRKEVRLELAFTLLHLRKLRQAQQQFERLGEPDTKSIRARWQMGCGVLARLQGKSEGDRLLEQALAADSSLGVEIGFWRTQFPQAPKPVIGTEGTSADELTPEAQLERLQQLLGEDDGDQ